MNGAALASPVDLKLPPIGTRVRIEAKNSNQHRVTGTVEAISRSRTRTPTLVIRADAGHLIWAAPGALVVLA